MNASFKKAHHREQEERQFCFDVAEIFGGGFERRLQLSRFVMKCPFDQVVIRGRKFIWRQACTESCWEEVERAQSSYERETLGGISRFNLKMSFSLGSYSWQMSPMATTWQNEGKCI